MLTPTSQGIMPWCLAMRPQFWQPIDERYHVWFGDSTTERDCRSGLALHPSQGCAGLPPARRRYNDELPRRRRRAPHGGSTTVREQVGMKVYALLNWYEEPPEWLAAVVASLSKICDGIVA